MTIARALPFRQASDGCFRRERWATDSAGFSGLLGESLPDWDAATEVVLQRVIAVDLDGVRGECGLPANAKLVLGASWRCAATTLRGGGTTIRLAGTGTVRHTLRLEIPGHLLAEEVELVVSLVLAERLTPAPLTARRVGTVLWESVDTLRLEGGGARFPIETLSFKASSSRFPSDAAWLLDVGDDWDAHVLAAMRLYLNEDHAAVSSALREPDAPASRVFLESMFWDVGRQLVRAALSSQDFRVAGRTFPRDTLGHVVSRLLRSRFGSRTLADLANEMERDPAGFDAILQDALGAWRSGP